MHMAQIQKRSAKKQQKRREVGGITIILHFIHRHNLKQDWHVFEVRLQPSIDKGFLATHQFLVEPCHPFMG